MTTRTFPPLKADHPLVTDAAKCPGCQQPFAAGDVTTLVVIGPGDDGEARRKAREGGFYDAVALPAHAACGGLCSITERLMEPDDHGLVFGTWDAPVTDDDTPIKTPVGNLCMHCQEAIVEGDNGRITAMGFTEHRECSLRGVMGGIGHHVDHARYCHGPLGTDAGLTRRESSLLVWEFLHDTGFFAGRAPTDKQLTRWRARLTHARHHHPHNFALCSSLI